MDESGNSGNGADWSIEIFVAILIFIHSGVLFYCFSIFYCKQQQQRMNHYLQQVSENPCRQSVRVTTYRDIQRHVGFFTVYGNSNGSRTPYLQGQHLIVTKILIQDQNDVKHEHSASNAQPPSSTPEPEVIIKINDSPV